jgi:hypothetical protein
MRKNQSAQWRYARLYVKATVCYMDRRQRFGVTMVLGRLKSYFSKGAGQDEGA